MQKFLKIEMVLEVPESIVGKNPDPEKIKKDFGAPIAIMGISVKSVKILEGSKV